MSDRQEPTIIIIIIIVIIINQSLQGGVSQRSLVELISKLD